MEPYKRTLKDVCLVVALSPFDWGLSLKVEAYFRFATAHVGCFRFSVAW